MATSGRLTVVTPYRPRNGTEGMGFAAQFCDRCTRGQSDRMCDIQARTFMHQVKDPEYPIEWIEDANGPRCTAFAPGVP